MSEPVRDYHLAADIMHTTTEAIYQALAGGEWSLRKKNDELRVNSVGKGTDWSMDIYPTFVSGDILVSGRFDGTLSGVTGIVEAMAKRLSAHGIASNFEFCDDEDRDIAVQIGYPASGR